MRVPYCNLWTSVLSVYLVYLGVGEVEMDVEVYQCVLTAR